MADEMLAHAPTAPELDIEPELMAEVVRGRRRFTTGEYHRMAEAGILGEGSRVELLAGEVIEMTPIGPLHSGRLSRLGELLIVRFAGRAVFMIQCSLRLDDFSELQPDLQMLKFRDDYYTGQLPTPADVLLLVEVGDSTAAFDRRVKLKLYARAGVPEVWLLDLPQDVITVHRGPSRDAYATNETFRRGMTLAPSAFPEDVFEVVALLG